MTRAPYVLPKSDKPFPAAHTDLYSTTLGWCMVNPRMEPQWTIPLGESAELIAEKHKITREQQDEFALASHRKAAEAQEAGLFDAELAPVPVPQRKGEPVLFGADECVRADASLEAMAKLKAVVPQGRRHGHPRQRLTSQRWGRRPLLLVDDDGLAATGREPLARISATGVNALDPHYFGLAPVEAVNRALAKAGKGFDDLSVLELNEAFAAQVLGCVAELPEFEPAILNPQGGAIALGHPLGAYGPPGRHGRPSTRPQGRRGGRGHAVHRSGPGSRSRPRTLTKRRKPHDSHPARHRPGDRRRARRLREAARRRRPRRAPAPPGLSALPFLGAAAPEAAADHHRGPVAPRLRPAPRFSPG
ncbi:hypothetical protein M2158_002646 [Streptomyces sp. SAI-144]|nr:hypothetical protein [Streptomyces sp. SAI-144]